MPTNWCFRENAVPVKNGPKAVGGGILGRFSNFDKCRSEVAGDDNRVEFGDPRLNRSREMPREAVIGGILDGCFAVASDRKQFVRSYPVEMYGISAWICL